MIVIQFFCIWINIKIISTYSYDLLAMVVVGIVMVATFVGGFKFSVESDQYQYGVMVVILALMSIFGKIQPTNITLGWGNWQWGVWGATALLVAPFLDGQQLQRAEESHSLSPSIIGMLLFGFYMGLVLLVYFVQIEFMKIFLAVVIVAIATSTLDSSVASLQYYLPKPIAIGLSILSFVSWEIMANKQALEIWSFYAGLRIYVVPVLIFYAIYERKRQKKIPTDSEVE